MSAADVECGVRDGYPHIQDTCRYLVQISGVDIYGDHFPQPSQLDTYTDSGTCIAILSTLATLFISVVSIISADHNNNA